MANDVIVTPTLTYSVRIPGTPFYFMNGIIKFNSCTYTTGGMTVTFPSNFKFTNFLKTIDNFYGNSECGYQLLYDGTNNKIKIYVGAGSELANGSSVDATFDFFIIGRSTESSNTATTCAILDSGSINHTHLDFSMVSFNDEPIFLNDVPIFV